jgi:ferrous iron transport protein A
MKIDSKTPMQPAEGAKHMTLTQLPKGQDARVTAVKGSGRITRRLMEMGVVPGVGVKVVKAAPFGDPIEIRVRGYSLAMRKSEADSIEVDG